MAIPVVAIITQSAFPHRALGTVNAARQLFGNLGAAVAVPLMTAVLVGRFADEI